MLTRNNNYAAQSFLFELWAALYKQICCIDIKKNCAIISIKRRHSSAGQSACFTRRRSCVRSALSPPSRRIPRFNRLEILLFLLFQNINRRCFADIGRNNFKAFRRFECQFHPLGERGFCCYFIAVSVPSDGNFSEY